MWSLDPNDNKYWLLLWIDGAFEVLEVVFILWFMESCVCKVEFMLCESCYTPFILGIFSEEHGKLSSLGLCFLVCEYSGLNDGRGVLKEGMFCWEYNLKEIP